MSLTLIDKVRQFPHRNQGSLLVAGPSGSGKSTLVSSICKNIPLTNIRKFNVLKNRENCIYIANQIQLYRQELKLLKLSKIPAVPTVFIFDVQGDVLAETKEEIDSLLTNAHDLNCNAIFEVENAFSLPDDWRMNCHVYAYCSPKNYNFHIYNDPHWFEHPILWTSSLTEYLLNNNIKQESFILRKSEAEIVERINRPQISELKSMDENTPLLLKTTSPVGTVHSNNLINQLKLLPFSAGNNLFISGAKNSGKSTLISAICKDVPVNRIIRFSMLENHENRVDIANQIQHYREHICRVKNNSDTNTAKMDPTVFIFDDIPPDILRENENQYQINHLLVHSRFFNCCVVFAVQSCAMLQPKWRYACKFGAYHIPGSKDYSYSIQNNWSNTILPAIGLDLLTRSIMDNNLNFQSNRIDESAQIDNAIIQSINQDNEDSDENTWIKEYQQTAEIKNTSDELVKEFLSFKLDKPNTVNNQVDNVEYTNVGQIKSDEFGYITDEVQSDLNGAPLDIKDVKYTENLINPNTAIQSLQTINANSTVLNRILTLTRHCRL